MPFSRLAFKKTVKGIRKKATGFVLLAILFLAVGLLQYAFVSRQIQKTTTLELNQSAGEIAKEIYKADKWDLKSYRQAFISASSWYVFTGDGFPNIGKLDAQVVKLLNENKKHWKKLANL